MLLRGLSETDRRVILAGARRRKFARREVLFHEGDLGDSVHLVASGHIGLRVTTPLGDTATMRVLGPGEFFGELAVLDAGHRSATAIAFDRVETLTIQRTQFDQPITQSSAAQHALTGALAAEIRRLAAALTEAMYLPADERFWRRMLDMLEVFVGDDATSGEIPLTQEELAQLAGATRPTVNRLLRDAQEHDAVTLRRGVVQVDDVDWVRRRARVRGSA